MKEKDLIRIVVPKDFNLEIIFKDSIEYPFTKNKDGKLIKSKLTGSKIKRRMSSDMYYIISLIIGNERDEWNKSYTKVATTTLPFNYRRANQIIETLIDNGIIEKFNNVDKDGNIVYSTKTSSFRLTLKYRTKEYEFKDIFVDYESYDRLINKPMIMVDGKEVLNNRGYQIGKGIMKDIKKIQEGIDYGEMVTFITELKDKPELNIKYSGIPFTIEQMGNYFNSLMHIKKGYHYVKYSDKTGAFYSNYSNMPSIIRERVGLSEMDLKSSVFWVLPKVLDLDMNDEETKRYMRILEGDIYKYIGNLFGKDREFGKKVALRDWLNTKYPNNSHYRTIEQRFPKITRRIEETKNIKTSADYKKYMNEFNKQVGRIINGIVEKVKKNYSTICVPIVDCIAVESEYLEDVIDYKNKICMATLGYIIPHKVDKSMEDFEYGVEDGEVGDYDEFPF